MASEDNYERDAEREALESIYEVHLLHYHNFTLHIVKEITFLPSDDENIHRHANPTIFSPAALWDLCRAKL